jgi:hypothetical protein
MMSMLEESYEQLMARCKPHPSDVAHQNSLSFSNVPAARPCNTFSDDLPTVAFNWREGAIWSHLGAFTDSISNASPRANSFIAHLRSLVDDREKTSQREFWRRFSRTMLLDIPFAYDAHE